MANRTKRSAKKDEEIIELLRRGYSMTGACRAVGISRTTFAEWRKEDPAFAAAVEEAYRVDGTEYLEDVARGRAEENSDTLLIFLLKARNPEKYRERAETRHVGDEEQPVSITLVRGS